ncbi:hypothetical protein BX600DRAFT_528485 [Xylariales sp. PMI_506]|nr:hypothetical protein BX600DRAFT_528485 [Xylariales sp. PMI_506]
MGVHLCHLLKFARDNSLGDPCIPPTKLFDSLDSYTDGNFTCSRPQTRINTRGGEFDARITQCLKAAVQSFTARWLPLVLHGTGVTADDHAELSRRKWYDARKAMMRAVNLVSYRSVLALYLFSQTPIPAGIPEEEKLDGISGMVCSQAALVQIQKLRARQQSHAYREFGEPAWEAAPVASASRSGVIGDYLDLESRAHWVAVMWDTANSLRYNIRASLTSGLRGACLEPVWQLVRTCLVGSFHPETEHWRTDGFEVSDGAACRIFSGATICNIYIWKTITSLKEALREGVDEEGVLFSWQSFLDALNVYKSSIRPLLTTCEKQLHFLDQLSRLRWYQVTIQYCMGILILVDAMLAANRSDLLSQINDLRQDAEHQAVNVIIFGVENTYTIGNPESLPGGGSKTTSNKQVFDKPTTASLISIDPCPQYVSAVVTLIRNIIARKRHDGKIKSDIYSHLLSVISKAQDQLVQTFDST